MGRQKDMDRFLSKKVVIIGICIVFLITSIAPALSSQLSQFKEKPTDSKMDFDGLQMEESRGTVTQTFNPIDDTFLDQWLPNNPDGALDCLIVRPPASGLEISSLLKFDLSSIPVGATITSATLKLYYFHYNDASPTGHSLNFYRITSNWNEEAVTYNTRPSYNPAIISSTTVPSSYGWMNWDFTTSARDIISGSVTNYGWQLMDLAGSNPMIYFHSKEYSDLTYYPYLEVQYTISDESIAANWLGEQRITNTTSSSEYPVIINDSSDNLHIFWQDTRDGHYEIYYKKMDKNGNQLISDKRITQLDAFNSQYPSADIDTNNNLHLVWQDNKDGNWEIYYQKLDNNGNIIGTLKRVTNALSDSLYPVLKVSEVGNVHIAWQDYRDGNYEIYYKKLNNSGVNLTNDVRITQQTAGSEYPSITIYSDYVARIAWQDNRDGNYEIYTNDAFIDVYPGVIDYSVSNSDQEKWHLAQIGSQVTINAPIVNGGNIDVSGVDVTLFVDGTELWTTAVDIAAEQNTMVSHLWLPSNEGIHNVTVVVDLQQELAEYDRANNNGSISLSVIDPTKVFEYKSITTQESYSNTILACKNLYIQPSGGLHLTNTQLIVYGFTPEINVNGEINLQNATITTSYPTEHIQTFLLSSTSHGQILHSMISQLGGVGIQFDSLPAGSLPFNGNVIKDSQHTAITCSNTANQFENNVILNSSTYDYNLIQSTVTVQDSYFKREKINVGPGSTFIYNKHISGTILDQNGNPADHAAVQIMNGQGTTVWTGFTDQNGQISSQLVNVFTQYQTSQDNYAPFAVHASDTSGNFCDFAFNQNGLIDPGSSYFGGGLQPYTVTQYALLLAGLDSPYQNGVDEDRFRHWNDIEYMYHVLTDIKGYKPENVYVVFMNGKDDDQNANAIIDYSATKANLQAALQAIGNSAKNDATHRDTLFVLVSDHGDDSPIKICMVDSSNDVTDGEFAQMINTYIGTNVSKMYFTLIQCFSGGFIDNLHGQNRIIATAASATESSWGYSGHNYFPVEFTSAFHNILLGGTIPIGYYPDWHLSNTPTDKWLMQPLPTPYHSDPLQHLDDNQDNQISFHEAYDYAHDNDLFGVVDGRAAVLYYSSNREHSQEVDDDIVVSSSESGKILIDRYDGDGSLSGTTLDVGGNLTKIYTCDMDKKNGDDIVVSDAQGNQVKVLLNQGDFTFIVTNYSVGTNPIHLAVADLNGDTYPDVVTANYADDDISALFNDGHGGLGSRKDYTTSQGPQFILLEDFDGDSDKDIITCSAKTDKVTFYTNNGAGSFTEYGSLSCTQNDHPSGVAVGDIDNDGDNDVIITHMGSSKVLVYKNQGVVGYSLSAELNTGTGTRCPTLIDLDNDNDKDLVFISSGGSANLWVYNNTGNGNYVLKKSYGTTQGAALFVPYDFFITDLDGDEDLDIVLTVQVPGSYSARMIFLNNDVNKEGTMGFTKQTLENADVSPATLKLRSVHGTNNNISWFWYLFGGKEVYWQWA